MTSEPLPMMGEHDTALFAKADLIVANAERDLGQLEYGVVVDLLADNTDWSLVDCKRARVLLVQDSRTRFSAMPVSKPKYAIMNTCDCPQRDLIAEWIDGVGYCYMSRIEKPSRTQYDGMTPQRPTAIEDFGFRVEFEAHTPGHVTFIRDADSKATYEDGQPRNWQDRANGYCIGEFFTLPSVKL